MANVDTINLILERVAGALDTAPPDSLIHVVLTGGETGTAITKGLWDVAAAIDPSVWSRVHLWWGDERFVPRDSPDRNDYRISNILGSYYSPNRVHRVLGSDECDNVQDAAADYTKQLLAFGFHGPQFRLVLLSLGPDGHVASLFPYSEQLSQTEPCVPVLNSPKPPPERVTLTFEMLNRSELTLLFAFGDSKSDARHRLTSAKGTVTETPGRGLKPSHLEVLEDL
jgi:6-phosphogluconolactonase